MVPKRSSVPFQMLFCMLKLVYLSYLLSNFSYNSGGFNDLPKNAQAIEHMGIDNLKIALKLGLALECIGIFGVFARMSTPNNFYLLTHLTLVPYYLWQVNFTSLWLIYVISLVSTIKFFCSLDDEKRRSDQKKNCSSGQKAEAANSGQESAPPSRPTFLEIRAAVNPNYGLLSVPKKLETFPTENWSREGHRSRPTYSQTRATNPTNQTNPNRTNRFEANETQKTTSNVSNSINHTVQINITTSGTTNPVQSPPVQQNYQQYPEQSSFQPFSAPSKYQPFSVQSSYKPFQEQSNYQPFPVDPTVQVQEPTTVESLQMKQLSGHEHHPLANYQLPSALLDHKSPSNYF